MSYVTVNFARQEPEAGPEMIELLSVAPPDGEINVLKNRYRRL